MTKDGRKDGWFLMDRLCDTIQTTRSEAIFVVACSVNIKHLGKECALIEANVFLTTFWKGLIANRRHRILLVESDVSHSR